MRASHQHERRPRDHVGIGASQGQRRLLKRHGLVTLRRSIRSPHAPVKVDHPRDCRIGVRGGATLWCMTSAQTDEWTIIEELLPSG